MICSYNQHNNKSILLVQSPKLLELYSFTQHLGESVTLIDIVEGSKKGGLLILSSNESFDSVLIQAKKSKFKYHLIEDLNLEVLRVFYNLKPFKIKDKLIFFEKISFIDLFKIIQIAIKEDYETIKIKTERSFESNSIVLSSDKINEKVLKKLKIPFKIITTSSSLRVFFDLQKA